MEVWLKIVPVVATLLVVLILVIIIVKWRQNILNRKMARLAQQCECHNYSGTQFMCVRRAGAASWHDERDFCGRKFLLSFRP